jgi:hypothetical protein
MLNWRIVCFILCISFVWGKKQPVVENTPNCGPSQKRLADGTCGLLTDDDVLRGIHFLANPPRTQCKNITIAQDLGVCEDKLPKPPKQCVVWSLITSYWCVHIGSLNFEKYWASRGCSVTVYHFIPFIKGNGCNIPDGTWNEHPNSRFVRLDLWAAKCYACFHKLMEGFLEQENGHVDVLKIQAREGVYEDFDNIPLSEMADWFHRIPHVAQAFDQIVFSTPMNTNTLIDALGREAEHGWNMYATTQFLSAFQAFYVSPTIGSKKLQPLQYDHLLHQANTSTEYSYYQTSYLRILDSTVKQQNIDQIAKWKPHPPPRALLGKVPAYCKVPSEEEDTMMQDWIAEELLARCHPTRLAVNCVRTRRYAPIIPCQEELMNTLAEDYAVSKGWCNFNHPSANIPYLTKVDAGAATAFQKPSFSKEDGKIRLAFFFTVYADATFVKRLFHHLYSPNHYYLFHIDPTGSSVEFEEELRTLSKEYSNVFFAKDVPIVYGASTATILLTKAMAWFYHFTKGWDYFIPLTGSDYPMIPLARMEQIFLFQQPPMPFIMGWTPGTSTHIFRLTKTHPIFAHHPEIVKSIKAVSDERGNILGSVPMEYRSNNFGPPLFCNGRSSFYHLDNRFNKSYNNPRMHDTQWLFPRDIYSKKGKAIAEEVPDKATSSFDGIWRVWKKSDPATTGAYDVKSIAYIIMSEEGKKYYHFFKHMLLGSEEHYQVSLLYNWPRTRLFIQTLSAQIVWNTWKLGLWEPSGGFLTHTHFLTMNEWDILYGFAMRGMMFARKFNTKKTPQLLDEIDRRILHNKTTEAGLYWPGFFEVDTESFSRVWVKAHRVNSSRPDSIHRASAEKIIDTYRKLILERPADHMITSGQGYAPIPSAGVGRSITRSTGVVAAGTENLVMGYTGKRNRNRGAKED